MVSSADMSGGHMSKRSISVGKVFVGAPFDDATYVNKENEKLMWFAVGKDPSIKDHMDTHAHTRTRSLKYPDNYYFVSLSLSLSVFSVCVIVILSDVVGCCLLSAESALRPLVKAQIPASKHGQSQKCR